MGSVHDGDRRVLSVENDVGASGATKGAKIEQMVRMTSDGSAAMSTHPNSLA